MEEMGEGSSRNMYKGHMDKAKGVGGRDGWDGGSHRGKIETTVLEQQQQQRKLRNRIEGY